MQKKSESYNYNVQPGEKHIQYSQVIEKNSHDNSFTIYKFTNYETNPNYNDHNIYILDNSYNYVNNLNLYLSYADRGFNDRSFERGNLYNTQKYLVSSDLSKRIVYEKNIDYAVFNSNTSNYVIGVYKTGPIAKSYKNYYYPYLPLRETEKTYSTDLNNFVSKIVDYTYDTKGYLIEKKLANSKNKNIITSFEYPYNSSVSGANLLVQKNMLNIPVKTEYFNELTKLSEEDIEFFINKGNVLPSNIKYGKGVITESNPLKSKIIYHNYDSKGNVREVSIEDGTHIVYIWGYNQTQPIAKIENATFTDIPLVIYNDILSKSNIDVDSATEQTLRSSLASLRTALPNSQVTTYTYDPLIGVTSITDPRGETIYYHYDTFNRLKYVKDANGNILSENQYHYKNQQE
jgi:YD repeat-containing protein